MKINLTALRKIKFKKCQITPVNGRRDDGRRFYITGRLPNYLRRPEILDGDAVTVLRDQSGKLLFRLLIPCPAGCNSLGEPLFLGCNLLRVAAQRPDWTFAEFTADGTPVVLAKKLFFYRDDSTSG